ncbi:MAG: hypothetical protein ABII71_02740 [Candidatus Micrarchaeota archaeon]
MAKESFAEKYWRISKTANNWMIMKYALSFLILVSLVAAGITRNALFMKAFAFVCFVIGGIALVYVSTITKTLSRYFQMTKEIIEMSEDERKRALGKDVKLARGLRIPKAGLFAGLFQGLFGSGLYRIFLKILGLIMILLGSAIIVLYNPPA